MGDTSAAGGEPAGGGAVGASSPGGAGLASKGCWLCGVAGKTLYVGVNTAGVDRVSVEDVFGWCDYGRSEHGW